MNSIPADALVPVEPGVLGAGGNPVSLNGLALTTNPAVPIGSYLSFPTYSSVAAFFGATSQEALFAAIYFSGFLNCNSLPSALLFAQFNTAAVAAYLRGASNPGLTLTQLQALSGTLTLTVNGSAVTSSAINLASATSFSNAATLITAGFTGGTVVCTYDSQRAAFVFTSSTTGSASTISYAAAGALATGLSLTQATGAILSQGAAAAVPATLMQQIVGLTQAFFSFSLVQEPLTAVKLAFAAWVQTTNLKYKYVQSDSDVTAPQTGNTTSFGPVVKSLNYNGVVAIYDPTGYALASFNMGATASIDPTETNGAITFAYKGQAGLAVSVTDEPTANGLIANGYNFYGQYATATQQFQLYQPGSISGEWEWDDAYVNQRIINSGLQAANLTLLATAKKVPYVAAGYGLIRGADMTVIKAMINFGAIVPGVELSDQQALEVNQAAGLAIDNTLSTVGYYLQILDPGAVVRGGRGSPACTLWYTDGGAVQTINLASIDVM